MIRQLLVIATLIFTLPIWAQKGTAFKEEATPLASDSPKELDETKSSGEVKTKKRSSRKRKKKSTKKKSTKEKLKGQWGIIQADGVAVYQAPSFDAPLLKSLSAGQKVRISRKIYQGIGGLGIFYKVRIGREIYGYLSDVDVAPEYKPQTKRSGKFKTSQEKSQPFKQNLYHQKKSKSLTPIFFTRSIGGTFGIVNFTEKFADKELSSNEWVVGLRMTGPGILAEELPLDLAFLFHQGGPAYYRKDASKRDASGFFILGDIFFPYPFLETQNSLISWGLGLMATYTKFSVKIKNSLLDSQELRIGLAAQASYSLRIDKYILRLEGKYYYEKTDYVGGFITLMAVY